MLDLDKARELVAKQVCVRPDWLPSEDEIVILDSETIERPWGWVFFYTSKLWFETREIRYALAGNSPLFVERETGKLLNTGTAHPIDYYIENYERTGNPHG